jgi:hypothetical protein
MPKKKRPPDQGRLVATIETVEQTYYASQNREHGDWFDDEAILDITGKVEGISPRHKRHLGQKIEMSFVCSRRFEKDVAEPAGKPFLLSVNLKKDCCSFMAYLPADAFWALPSMIASKAVTRIEAMFGEPHSGSADLIGVYFATTPKLGSLPTQE